MYIIEERSKLLAKVFGRRKKLLAEERAAVRNKPPTRTQLRSLMMTYLKHIGKYRHNQLNKKTFEEIQDLYIKEQERDADFVPIGSERDEKMIDKMNKKAAEEQLRASLKRVPDEEEEIDYEVLGTRYLIVNWESAFYHTDRYGVPHDYYKVFRANGSSRYIKTFTEMVSIFDRLDFIELYSLVMQRFSTTTPEGIDLVLRGDLRIMFEETTDDDIWKNQEKWIIKSWAFYENYGVHILALEDGTEIHMLAKKRYLLIRETLERMMELRLTAESKDIKNWLVQKQTTFGKYFLNPFKANSLLKTIWFSTHHASHAPCYSNKALAIPEQTATGKEISNPFMAGLMGFRRLYITAAVQIGAAMTARTVVLLVFSMADIDCSHTSLRQIEVLLGIPDCSQNLLPDRQLEVPQKGVQNP
ncbi:hypothetical protein Tco_0154997 [Tanacetum coccineum]